MKYFNVGTIVNTRGLQGEMKIKPVTDFAEERFKKGSELSLFDQNGEFVMDVIISFHRKYKNFEMVKFKDMDHIDSIEKFRNFTLKVSENNQMTLGEGEFYYHEIIGLDVYERDICIGKIKEILQPGANDVWVVKRMGQKDLLLPYISSVVLVVDLKNGLVEVELPEGLDNED